MTDLGCFSVKRELYTIGHSTHALEHVLGLLELHRITAVCDVRSSPYSRRNPQFDRETLKKALESRGVRYVFLGGELGARTSDESCYEDGRVQYDRLASTETFQRGLERVKAGMTRFRVALLCAEKDPINCHRTILVCRRIKGPDVTIQHILENGELEPQEDTERRLVKKFGLEQRELFDDETSAVDAAYKLQEERIAYTKPEMRSGRFTPGTGEGNEDSDDWLHEEDG